ncbi:SBBP repeat-containing protein [Nannocystis punicea]|uniref:SBBP repeat-containing protein n=1 Tax=Nannocystis punicea TaxID=2995304 RepID=A0ABY7H0S3_9BACT|nr:SBBP repeat-containing protein [Nannocystis poenicansa]WAS92778.1 SBBP repeat-containing protein [Nannocystis poenicansa]
MFKYFVMASGVAATFAIGLQEAHAAPLLDWSSYYGGTGDEAGFDANFNLAGELVVVGVMSSNGFATAGAHKGSPSADDGFIAQIDPVTEMVNWHTYYGGTGTDRFRSVDHDSNDNVHAVGDTTSTTGVASAGGGSLSGSSDAMVVKFTSSGGRTWGRYFGGPSTETGEGVCVGSDGTVYMVGATNSSSAVATVNDTTYGGIQDGYLAKWSSAGVFQRATYIGGSSGTTTATGCAVDANGDVVVVGYTEANAGIATPTSQDPSYNGSGDAFVIKYDSSLTPLWGRYFGGTSLDRAEAVDVDEDGDVYVTGHTQSSSGLATNWDTILGGGHDAFVARFVSLNGNLVWSRYYGGSAIDELDDIEVVESSVYLSGWSTSTSGVTSVDSFDDIHGGGADCLFVILGNNGSTSHGSYIGGASTDNCMGVAAELGNAAVSGYTTGSSTGIATPGAIQTSFGGGFFPWDAIMAYITL